MRHRMGTRLTRVSEAECEAAQKKGVRDRMMPPYIPRPPIVLGLVQYDLMRPAVMAYLHGYITKHSTCDCINKRERYRGYTGN